MVNEMGVAVSVESRNMGQHGGGYETTTLSCCDGGLYDRRRPFVSRGFCE